MSPSPRTGQKSLHGIPVSGGVAQGKAFVVGHHAPLEIPCYEVAETDREGETDRLESALVATRQQLNAIRKRVADALGHSDAEIFEAQLMFLDDPVILGEVVKLIDRKRVNVEQAFSSVSSKYIKTLSELDDSYFAERTADLRDVSTRVLENLLGRSQGANLSEITAPCVLVANDLTPSQTALLDKRMVLGFATDQGSRTSHSAILARSIGLPAVTGLIDASQQVYSGQYVMLDGYTGCLIIEPTDQTLFEYGQLERKHHALEERLKEVREQPAITLDGARIVLSANIERPEESADVLEHGAEGVGLYRTEYLFLNRNALPTEDQQYAAYRQVVEQLHPQPVIIRTLDVGGDKMFIPGYSGSEQNPFMGWRAIRICLQEEAIFRAQLRAILRASVHGNVKLMYPMISSLEELVQANEVLERSREELRRQGRPFDENLEVGAMIEMPGAVMAAEALAKRVDFFSIGTNDLIQYTLAVDRTNPKIAHLYDPTHPGVLRLIKRTVEAARANDIWVGVCGEMAGDPIYVPLLLGLGADELSAAPACVPAVKFLIRRLKMTEANSLAEFALDCEYSRDILEHTKDLARSVAESLFEQES